jgi:hypothetical protein
MEKDTQKGRATICRKRRNFAEIPELYGQD